MLKRFESIVNGGGKVMTLKNVVSTSGEAVAQSLAPVCGCRISSQPAVLQCSYRPVIGYNRSETHHDFQFRPIVILL